MFTVLQNCVRTTCAVASAASSSLAFASAWQASACRCALCAARCHFCMLSSSCDMSAVSACIRSISILGCQLYTYITGYSVILRLPFSFFMTGKPTSFTQACAADSPLYRLVLTLQGLASVSYWYPAAEGVGTTSLLSGSTAACCSEFSVV